LTSFVLGVENDERGQGGGLEKYDVLFIVTDGSVKGQAGLAKSVLTFIHIIHQGHVPGPDILFEAFRCHKHYTIQIHGITEK
jgi:hypothetical protein